MHGIKMALTWIHTSLPSDFRLSGITHIMVILLSVDELSTEIRNQCYTIRCSISLKLDSVINSHNHFLHQSSSHHSTSNCSADDHCLLHLTCGA